MDKLTAYQRIEVFADKGTFEEVGQTGDRAITGMAKVNGRQVFIVVVDAISIGQHTAEKINHLLDMAVKYKAPVVTFFESVGARIQEGVVGMHYVGMMFRKFSEISGVIPTIAIQLGINSGATAYSAGLMDFVIMVEHSSYTFITGPKVIEQMTGEKAALEELGGASVHGAMTGLATFTVANEYKAIRRAQQLLDYLPQHCYEIALNIDPKIKKEKKYADLVNIIPQENKRQGYDMTAIIQELADDDSFLELYSRFAPNLIIGFARMGNVSVGIAANQPLYLSGILDVDSCKKLFRFVQICDAYNIPLLFIADSPGFMPGKEQEQASMIALGARVLSILSTSTIPKITLLVNKIIGGAYGGMSSRGLGADLVFAWPTAQISVLGTKAALSIIYRKEIENAEDQDACRNEKINEFESIHLTPYLAAEHGQVDAVIHPEETRKIILRSFMALQNKVVTPIKKRRSIIPM